MPPAVAVGPRPTAPRLNHGAADGRDSSKSRGKSAGRWGHVLVRSARALVVEACPCPNQNGVGRALAPSTSYPGGVC